MENQDIRDHLRAKRIPIYRVAHKIGISEMTLFRWLRVPLSQEHRRKIVDAINEVTVEMIEELNSVGI